MILEIKKEEKKDRPASALCGTFFRFKTVEIGFRENAKEYEDPNIGYG